ncbi:villin-1 isoform X2 [Manihot esculenta]|uniref:villin-1 isoform X2 n=1 Tax=Manihot esculenta TaxID=3983 RepID=UPI001CC62C1A|nr:villin-1 isoform X2 [Manihot esculenta]
MALVSKDIDSAFDGAGAKPGLEIWCVENLRLVPLPTSLHGRFYSGSAYIVLNVESALASDKALELDAALGSCTVQYREVQGQETEKFLSYFKPCIIPSEGVYLSQLGQLDSNTYKVSLLKCKGDHVVSVKEVPFSRSSLNHNDVFILDTASKIFLFSGCNSSIQERAKALEVVQYVKENKHGGKCEVATIEDGKFVGDSDVGEFWSFFGGYAPIPRDIAFDVQKECDTSPVQLSWITTQGKLCPKASNSLNKEMLDSNKCYMLDGGAEIFVWMGRNTSLTERKMSISVIEDFLRNQGRSTATHLTFLTEGLETSLFRSFFESWPQVEPNLYEEGRGKVAAIFKKQGYEVKELPDAEDCQPYINCQGKLKVWRVDGDELILVPAQEQIKLFSGDCYVVQYTYAGDGRDENLFYAWLGRASALEDRADAITHMTAIADSTKGDPVLARVMQDKEPLQLLLIFQTVIILKGGLSKRYRTFIAENGILDETYEEGKPALFRVQGTSPSSMQAIQVDQVSSSLNSSYCYILQTGRSTLTWMGNLSSTIDHDLLDRMLELINPTWQPISVREGSEPDIFWEALGGKTEYPREQEIKQHIEDPHLFAFMFADGDFKVKEIYNFTQDDLTTEDVLLLDCHEEIYVWIGCHANVKSKQQALMFGLNFLENAQLVGGLSIETPIYVVTEGKEPLFFTRFFEWDSSKANMLGNSFERKLAILKGKKPILDHRSPSYKRKIFAEGRVWSTIANEHCYRFSVQEHIFHVSHFLLAIWLATRLIPIISSRKASCRETTPDNSRSNSVSSNGRGSSLSNTSSVSGSKSKSANNHLFSGPTPIARMLFPGSPDGSAGSPQAEAKSPPDANLMQVDSSITTANTLTYPYSRLIVGSSDPATDIDVTRREAYLSDEEFLEKFGMMRKAFYQFAKWRQNKLKLSLQLF